MLTFGNKPLLVEALVIPHLSLDVMLIDNSTMKVFGAKLDWTAERLLFRDIVMSPSRKFIQKISGDGTAL